MRWNSMCLLITQLNIFGVVTTFQWYAISAIFKLILQIYLRMDSNENEWNEKIA